MRRLVQSVLLAACILAGLAAARTAAAVPQQKDYLSEEEADKIRNADTPAARITLYVSFADDRLKKFDYEIHRAAPQRRRVEILNGLLNAYIGCLDDGADQIAVAREKQADIREALKLVRAKGQEFLDALEKYHQSGPELDTYRDTLEDAIEGTKDALADAAEAEKEMPPAPVRRKP
jgi:hypothetical protein